mmetsp:Transcript_629/g.2338  ORF Transcript_629/g.2338 Transcript_629/m.2338 type:complete len:343 (-) Transcript_629:10163-11191(-)
MGEVLVSIEERFHFVQHEAEEPHDAVGELLEEVRQKVFVAQGVLLESIEERSRLSAHILIAHQDDAHEVWIHACTFRYVSDGNAGEVQFFAVLVAGFSEVLIEEIIKGFVDTLRLRQDDCASFCGCVLHASHDLHLFEFFHLGKVANLKDHRIASIQKPELEHQFHDGVVQAVVDYELRSRQDVAQTLRFSGTGLVRKCALHEFYRREPVLRDEIANALSVENLTVHEEGPLNFFIVVHDLPEFVFLGQFPGKIPLHGVEKGLRTFDEPLVPHLDSVILDPPGEMTQEIREVSVPKKLLEPVLLQESKIDATQRIEQFRRDSLIPGDSRPGCSANFFQLLQG